jgi:hypothetical protein
MGYVRNSFIIAGYSQFTVCLQSVTVSLQSVTVSLQSVTVSLQSVYSQFTVSSQSRSQSVSNSQAVHSVCSVVASLPWCSCACPSESPGTNSMDKSICTALFVATVGTTVAGPASMTSETHMQPQPW